MKLTISVFTRNHADWLPRILPQFQRIADELVVVVNSSTIDNSEEVARRYTDRVFLVPHEVIPERQSRRVVSLCRGDWILQMLDDETLSSHWENREYVERLLADRDATHYSIPRRWLIPPGDRYISNSRWYPDFQMRLFRNIPSIIDFPERLHSVPIIAGEPRFLSEAWMYHWDLIWRDRAAREAKIAEYRLTGSDPLAQYYLFEEQTLLTEAKDHEVKLGENLSAEEVRVGAFPPGEFRVGIVALDPPMQLRRGEEHAVTVAILNQSTRLLRPSSHYLRAEKIAVSYHWFRENSGMSASALWENARREVPQQIVPGEIAHMILTVTAPDQPGEYELAFDLVEDGVAWFSQFVPSVRHRVRVTD